MDAETKNHYDSLLSSMQLSELEQYNLELVKAGIAADQKLSPFVEHKWYKEFSNVNQDGFQFAEAPSNVFLMVVSDSFGTLIKNGRGTGISRGSVFVKLDRNLINCVDGTYWYASPDGRALVYPQTGYFEVRFDSSSPSGRLKLLSDISHLSKNEGALISEDPHI